MGIWNSNRESLKLNMQRINIWKGIKKIMSINTFKHIDGGIGFSQESMKKHYILTVQINS